MASTTSTHTTLMDESEFPILTPEELTQIATDHCLNGEPLLIYGDPGCGKSEIVSQVAQACGKPMHAPINLALSDGTDLKGLPKLDDGYVRWVKEQRWMADYPATIFLDEIAQAPVLTQCAAAPLILEKRVDDLYLHPASWVVGASNFPKNKAGTNRIPSHLPNRCTNVALAYHAESQVNWWLTQSDIDLLTMRFTRMKGDGVFFFDPANTINATPRQWTWVARKLFANPDTPFATIAGRIGRGNAAELMAFRDLAPQLPSPEEVLLNPTGARVPDGVSAQFLVTDMLADHASAGNFDTMVTYAKRLPPEMQAKFVRDSMKRKPEVAATKAFVQWGVKFAEVLR